MTPLSPNTTARAARYQAQFERCCHPEMNRLRRMNEDNRRRMAKASDQARRQARRAKQDRGVAQ